MNYSLNSFKMVKIMQRKNVICLSTAQSNFKCNALLLQLSFYEKNLNLLHKNNQSYLGKLMV